MFARGCSNGSVRACIRTLIKLQLNSRTRPVTARQCGKPAAQSCVERIHVYRRFGRRSYSTREFGDCDATEMKVFLGLLICTSVYKYNHENVNTIFATDGTGREIFRMIMSTKRFYVLLVCLRFDDVSVMEVKNKYAPAIAVSLLLEQFERNS
ncbi:hypothetical protein PR048_020256 [Dryococelus australis]|uniref:PiggyBac transposable element-derived protein domain-containing protein n=1 Tax=Dryococelus australis TaxID=614101 RepID=A0ABQ9H5S8_9NEOP|nr:hypothetical protein PR048_020256 [Dryococelus australis]